VDGRRRGDRAGARLGDCLYRIGAILGARCAFLASGPGFLVLQVSLGLFSLSPDLGFEVGQFLLGSLVGYIHHLVGLVPEECKVGLEA
jgi:hypothetical protein